VVVANTHDHFAAICAFQNDLEVEYIVESLSRYEMHSSIMAKHID